MEQPEVFTLGELFRKGSDERQDRLQNGLKKDDFHVYFRKSNLTIQIKQNDIHLPEIDLETCNNSRDLLDWIFFIHSGCGNSNGLLAAILTVLDDACYVIHGKDARTLFLSNETLNWRNPKSDNE